MKLLLDTTTLRIEELNKKSVEKERAHRAEREVRARQGSRRGGRQSAIMVGINET